MTGLLVAHFMSEQSGGKSVMNMPEISSFIRAKPLVLGVVNVLRAQRQNARAGRPSIQT